jgi:hypothetical protein
VKIDRRRWYFMHWRTCDDARDGHHHGGVPPADVTCFNYISFRRASHVAGEQPRPQGLHPLVGSSPAPDPADMVGGRRRCRIRAVAWRGRAEHYQVPRRTAKDLAGREDDRPGSAQRAQPCRLPPLRGHQTEALGPCDRHAKTIAATAPVRQGAASARLHGQARPKASAVSPGGFLTRSASDCPAEPPAAGEARPPIEGHGFAVISAACPLANHSAAGRRTLLDLQRRADAGRRAVADEPTRLTQEMGLPS